MQLACPPEGQPLVPAADRVRTNGAASPDVVVHVLHANLIGEHFRG